MDEKKCSKCGTVKLLGEFHKQAASRDRHCPWCKACVKVSSRVYNRKNRRKSKIYREKNKDKIKAYYEKNGDKLRENGRAYYKKNKEKMNGYSKVYYERNKNKMKQYYKAYWKENKDEIKKYKKVYQENNKEELSRKRKIYKEKNKDKIRAYYNDWQANRCKIDLSFKLNKNMSGGIRRSLKGKKGGFRWETFVEYSLEELKKHLNLTMPRGYIWNDFLSGDLHIDHRIPIAIFNIKSAKSKGFKACWQLENLRLLPASENHAKRDKLFV